ncbi:MAG: deoxyribonuclease IV, partial [Pseudonocardiaceae bacterium]
MRIGAHVNDDDPIKAATERNAAAVQFFLADPQSWTAPRAHPQADQLHTA